MAANSSLMTTNTFDKTVTQPLLSVIQTKKEAIVDACHACNAHRLRELATEDGGLLEDKLRQSAWPLLLGCQESELEKSSASCSWETLPPHSDEEQVQKDVDRAFVYYPKDDSQKSVDSRKKKLFDLTARVLRVNRMLHYFQGYHDIVQVFLLVLGEDTAFQAVSRVSLLRIRDYMLYSITPAEKHLQLIPAILKAADPVLAHHLSRTPPFFALSATLTLYAHEIEDYAQITRLYDFILAQEPVLTIYLFTALVIHRRVELLEIEDADMLLFTLSKLPQPLDLEVLISKSLSLYLKYPPERLPGRVWQSISRYSVLKTARTDVEQQTLENGRNLFALQSQRLHRDAMIRKAVVMISRQRRPLISIGATVIVGLLSYWLRSSGNDRLIWTVLGRAAEQVRRRWHF